MSIKHKRGKHPLERRRTHRRALLGAISGAGVVGAAKLPGQWTRPVVDHVLLPAHAATTDDTGSSPTGGSTFITTVTSNCAVTCTSAIAVIGVSTSTGASTAGLVNVTQYVIYDVTNCIDATGGTTSAGGSSLQSSYVTGSFASTLGGTSYSGSTLYTTNGMCYVTMTSS